MARCVLFVPPDTTDPGLFLGFDIHREDWHGDPTLGHAIVVVLGADRDDRFPSVQEILGQLGLGFDAAQPPSGPVDGDAVAFRVPHERLAEVVVGLESGGFTDVRAYEGRDGHPMP